MNITSKDMTHYVFSLDIIVIINKEGYEDLDHIDVYRLSL